MAGRGTGIKERNIAVEVFGKGHDFDSQVQSIVRVKAVEVRRRLAQAYHRVSTGWVYIELPVGTYQPLIQFTRNSSVPAAKPNEPAALHRPNVSWKKLLWIPLAAVILAVFVVALRRRASGTSFDELWQPFVNQERPVLISLPAPPVFTLRGGTERLPATADVVVPVSDLQLTESAYVGVGAAAGAARFGEQFALRHHPFLMKFGSDVSFADLRQGPAILLGALTSRLTIEMMRTLPLRFDEERPGRIVDSADPARAWTKPSIVDRRFHAGFALISRLLNSESGNPVLMVAGMSAFDTQSAVDFLTHKEFFSQFASQAQNWPNRNFEILLGTAIHDHTPGRSKVITTRLW